MKTNIRSDWKMIIDSPDTLERAADYYHDQQFDLNNAIFDEENKEFSIEYWRIIYEEARQKRDYILYQVLVAPVIRTKLVFYNVHEANIYDEEPDDQMNTIKYIPAKGEIQFECAKGTKILLKITRLKGILRDIDEKFSDAHVWNSFSLD